MAVENKAAQGNRLALGQVVQYLQLTSVTIAAQAVNLLLFSLCLVILCMVWLVNVGGWLCVISKQCISSPATNLAHDSLQALKMANR